MHAGTELLADLLAQSTQVASGPTASSPGLSPDAVALHAHWVSAWSVPTYELIPILLVGLLYGARIRRISVRPSSIRIASFYAGLGVLVLAVFSPIDAVGEDGMLAVHMLQHTLLGTVAPLLMLLGLTGPVLRPLLSIRWVRRLMVLTHPLVAFPAWVASMVFWHIPAVYEAALANDTIHAILHISLVSFGLLVWTPIVEPVRGDEGLSTRFKCAYAVGMYTVGLITANIFWFSGTVFYTHYLATAPAFGVSALQDQGNAGTVMMATHCSITLVAAVVLFFRQAREEQLRQRLVEAGLGAERVDRAVHAGRLRELALRHGISTEIRPGID